MIENSVHFCSLLNVQRSCEEILEGKPSPHGIKLIQTWEDFKVSGKGVVVLVVDSGIRTDHLDLDVVSMKFSY